MSRRAVIIAIVVVAALASGVAWEVASPWWTLKDMRNAAKAGDGNRLASYVDFPRVRADLREQLIDAANEKIPARAFEAILGKHRVDRIIDPVINAIVSPKSLQVALDVAPKGSASGNSAKPGCGMKREDLSHFSVRCAKLANGQADLRFERQGFSWKLVGIDLPDEYGARII